VTASQAEINTTAVINKRKIEATLAPTSARRKLIRKGVSISSRAKVGSSGMVDLNAATPPIWMIVKIRLAKSRKRSLPATAIVVSSTDPVSNNTR
jgi:hypothetical protein